MIRNLLPVEFADAAWHSTRRYLRRPHVVDVGLAYGPGDVTAVALITGPWWLAATNTSLVALDAATGHRWGHVLDWTTRLEDRYGREDLFPITDRDARRWAAVMGWDHTMHYDEDEAEAP